MAHEKEFWKDALQTAKSKRSRQDNEFDKAAEKKAKKDSKKAKKEPKKNIAIP